MHIVVVGAGAIGTLYGGWLIAGGGDVSFLARGARLDQLRSDGIALEGPNGDFRQAPVEAADRADALRPADVLLMTVKLYDLDEAARANSGSLVPGGLVVGLQNGVEAGQMLRATFPAGQVMVGPVYSAVHLASGTAIYSGTRHLVTIGSETGDRHPHAEPLLALWRAAGIRAEVSGDIRSALWNKLVLLGTNAALTCLTRSPAGIVYHDPDLLALARQSMAEIIKVGRAEGAAIADDAAEKSLALLKTFPPDMVASMRHDLDAGRRLELDGISGAIGRHGRKHGIETPFHDFAFACLKPWRDGAKPFPFAPDGEKEAGESPEQGAAR